MCSELCKDFYVVYQLEMVAGEVESSCQLVVTFFFFFFFFFLVSPYQTIEISLGQPSPPSYQLLPPPLAATKYHVILRHLYHFLSEESDKVGCHAGVFFLFIVTGQTAIADAPRGRSTPQRNHTYT